MKICRNKILLACIVLVAVGVRIFRMLEMNRYDSDCYTYFTMAVNWAKYGFKVAYQFTGAEQIPPFLPCLMAAGFKLGFPPEETALFFGIILGSIVPLCVYYTVSSLFSVQPGNLWSGEAPVPERKFSGFRASDLALLAAFIAAVHPSLVRISVRCLRDTFYIPLAAIAVVCAVSAIKNRSVLRWCVFSFMVFLATMARYEGPEMILMFILWIVIEFVFNFKQVFAGGRGDPAVKRFSLLRYYSLSFISVITVFCVLTYLELFLMEGSIYRHIVWSIIKNAFSGSLSVIFITVG